jgi:hypothetical protein
MGAFVIFSSVRNEAGSGARHLELCFPLHTGFVGASTSHQVVPIFIYNTYYIEYKNFLSKEIWKDPSILVEGTYFQSPKINIF